MKTFAYLFNNYNSPIIEIHEACRRKKHYAGKWETWTYYDIVKLREMVATCRETNCSSFTYKRQITGGGHSRGSKGISHELVQQYICCLGRTWKFRLLNREFEISIDRIEDEYMVDDEDNGKKYFIDCMIHLTHNTECYDLFNGKIGIEVTDTSETSNSKKKYFKDNNITVLELRTIGDWHLPNAIQHPEKKVREVRNRINGFLNANPNLFYINLPNHV